MSKVVARVFIILLVSLSLPLCAQEKPFLIGWEFNDNDPSHNIAILAYQEAFKRLDIPIAFVSLPLKRSTKMLNEGRIDMEMLRIKNYNKFAPNSLRVPESLFKMALIAFSADSTLNLNNGWKSFQDTTYRVEYRRGIIITRNNLSKYLEPKYISQTSDLNFGLQRLLKKRIDFFIAGHAAIPQLYIPQVHTAGVMTSIDLYPHLHKSHHKLVEPLAKVLKELKKEGFIQELFERYNLTYYP